MRYSGADRFWACSARWLRIVGNCAKYEPHGRNGEVTRRTIPAMTRGRQRPRSASGTAAYSLPRTASQPCPTRMSGRSQASMPPPAIEITSGGNMIQYQGFRRRRIVAIPEAMATARSSQRPNGRSANGIIGEERDRRSCEPALIRSRPRVDPREPSTGRGQIDVVHQGRPRLHHQEEPVARQCGEPEGDPVTPKPGDHERPSAQARDRPKRRRSVRDRLERRAQNILDARPGRAGTDDASDAVRCPVLLGWDLRL